MSINYIEKHAHISDIKVGDTILHSGHVTTVCNNDIKLDAFMGITVFGDSYNLGHKPVIKIDIVKASKL